MAQNLPAKRTNFFMHFIEHRKIMQP